MDIKFKSLSGVIPTYATPGAAGMDICAYLKNPLTIYPGDRVLIPTGLFSEFPEGIEAQLRARSGLAIRQGLTLANAVGTIDSDYRGEWKVPLINLGKGPITIYNGDRIAQVVFANYVKVNALSVDSLSDSDRGEGGFGSTGI